MKTIQCDVCKRVIEEASNTIAPEKYWVKLLMNYVGKKYALDDSLDLCKVCYLKITVFIDILTECRGELKEFFIAQLGIVSISNAETAISLLANRIENYVDEHLRDHQPNV